jgi:hypothetical protein
MTSKAFGSKGPLIPHHAPATQEIGDLRADVEEAMLLFESRVGYPFITKVAGGAAVSVGTPAAHAITGAGLLQDQVSALLAVAGTSTGLLTFTANRPGTPGNALSVVVVDSAGGGLAVTVVGGTQINIDLGGATSTVAQVKAAVDAYPAAHALAQVAATGTGNGKIVAEAFFTGGVGLGTSVLLGGVEQTLTAVVTATAIAMLTAGSFGANGDTAVLVVTANGRVSNTVSVDVVT